MGQAELRTIQILDEQSKQHNPDDFEDENPIESLLTRIRSRQRRSQREHKWIHPVRGDHPRPDHDLLRIHNIQAKEVLLQGVEGVVQEVWAQKGRRGVRRPR